MRHWAIDNLFPREHRIVNGSPEGTYKTWFNCALAVSIAMGKPFLGQEVRQGTVIIVDEETPKVDVDDRLSRLALHYGIKDWTTLPIVLRSKMGFRFGHKTELDKLLKVVIKVKPMLVTFDSLVAMIPGGRKGNSENDASLGITVRDDLTKVINEASNVLLCAHSKKPIAEISLSELKALEMQNIVRGSGAIIGEACDTGISLKKISEYPPRFVMIIKSRRVAIPLSHEDIYIELKEESYGKGWAKLIRIKPIALPPCKMAKDIFPAFKDVNTLVSQKQLGSDAYLHSRSAVREGIEELLARKVILNSTKPFHYSRNPNAESEVDAKYWQALTMKQEIK